MLFAAAGIAIDDALPDDPPVDKKWIEYDWWVAAVAKQKAINNGGSGVQRVIPSDLVDGFGTTSAGTAAADKRWDDGQLKVKVYHRRGFEWRGYMGDSYGSNGYNGRVFGLLRKDKNDYPFGSTGNLVVRGQVFHERRGWRYGSFQIFDSLFQWT
jgi:hypothetical protein